MNYFASRQKLRIFSLFSVLALLLVLIPVMLGTAVSAATSSNAEIGTPVMITAEISSGADDGSANATSFFKDGSWYQLGNPSSPSNGWFRFTGVNVPAGATILEARLYTVHGKWSNGTHLTIRAEKSANPSAPVSAADLAGRTATTASVAWDSGYNNWAWQNSPNIASVIQELVNSYNYSSGSNAIQLLVSNAGSSPGCSYIGLASESGFAPVLYITYNVNPTSTIIPSGQVTAAQAYDLVYNQSAVVLDMRGQVNGLSAYQAAHIKGAYLETFG